jgi:chloramphenicol 3-O phosphotransferase
VALIIVLNGVSSAGKTTLARALQERAARLFLNFSIDSILYALPEKVLERMKTGGDLGDLNYVELVRGYYGCVKQLADAGNSIISDNALTTRWQADLLLDAVEGHDVVLVKVDCAEASAVAREAARGDRRPGLARSQMDKVHRWLDYDVVVNSDELAPEAAADIVLEAAARKDNRAVQRSRAMKSQ